ncbi:MAG: NAD-dependent epimerase/dehydratase family protein [Gallionella sp.]|nr:NAD-dependent epimerase/dehydratase family protein [Gallionella sp.]
MRVLVTGLRGFTGHYVQRELEAYGHQVVGLKSDLTQLESVRQEVQSLQPDAVIHLAAISFVGHGDANAFYQVNLIGTRNLLDALSEHAPNLQRVLLASSANVYGNATEGVINESALPGPVNDYAVSKLAMEYMSRIWMDRLPIVITRPFNYTGVGQAVNFLLPKIVDHFRRGAGEIELGNLDVERDFSDVRTVASIYRCLVECGTAGEIFNVCSGDAFSLSDILAMMAEISGYKIDVKVNPAFVRKNEVRRLVGCSDKLVRHIGKQEALPLRSTLEWMYLA